MNIIISAFACDPSKGSENGNGWNWVYQNYKLGNKVICLTAEFGQENIIHKLKENPDLASEVKFVFIKMPSLLEKYFPTLPGFYVYYLYWQFKALKKTKKILKEHGIDLIHHVTIGSIQMGSFLWKVKKPFIFGPAGGGQFAPEVFKGYFGKHWKTERMRKFISYLFTNIFRNFNNMMQKSSLILATNQETYSMAKKYGAKNVKLFLDTSLPLEFFPENFPERQKSENLRILWVGRFMPRKGLPLVIESLKFVSNSTKYHLTVVGDGELKDDVTKMTKDLDLEEKITFTGMIPWKEVSEKYLNHDCFIFCSFRDSSAAQLLEAMAFGLPIITLNIHGAKNLVPEVGGVKIELKDDVEKIKTEIAKSIDSMYQNPEKRLEMGLNSYLFAKSQNWNEKVLQINNLYEEILQKT